MKKVAVIPYSDYEKMNNNNSNTSQPRLIQQPLPITLYEPKMEQLTSIENELMTILNSNMNIHEKRTKYQDMLQKLVDLKEKYGHDNEAVSTPEKEVKDTEEKDLKTILEYSLPVSVKNRGIALFNTLKNQIVWDKTGQIIIDDKPIPGSNIIDLISDLVRNWRRSPVTGWPIIKQKLRNINLPRSLILNTNRLEELENVQDIPETLASNIPRAMTSSTTPPLGLTRTRVRKNPYPSVKRLRKQADVMRVWLKL